MDRAMNPRIQLVVVTGLSGSGKSSAIRVLEDLGFYCVDNLPVALIQRFVELWGSSTEEINRVALGIDLRERGMAGELPRMLDDLRAQGHSVTVIFLDAADDVLVRRFSESRRPHPLAPTGAPADGIRREREKLTTLRERADRVLDTSGLTVHELRETLRRFVDGGDQAGQLAVGLRSFGFKYGLPSDADLVLDVRFLPNPFYVEELRPRTGLDAAVRDYVLLGSDAVTFLDRLMALLEFALPGYRREGKSYLTIAIGCTGGRHRSVALAEEIGRRLAHQSYRIQVQHRDIER
jgi:UPF0042 nucleotide-binding protein